MRGLPSLLASLVIMAAGEASAQSLTEYGHFEFLQADDICGLTSEFEFDGRSDVAFRLIANQERTILILASIGWSALPEGASLDYILLDAGGKIIDSYEATPSSTKVSGYIPGFTIVVGEDFLRSFAQGSSMLVRYGENTITHINLRGSSAGTAALTRCQRQVIANVAAKNRAEQRWDYISKDPFAPPPSPDDVRWSRAPRVIERDIPQRALDAQISGSAEVSCLISTTGRPESCRVEQETPAGYGFGAAAIRVVSRAQGSATLINQRITVTINFDKNAED